MKITDYIEGYDTMTAEEKEKALAEFSVPDPDPDKFISKSDYDKLKTSHDKLSSEIAQKKKEDREKLSESEKLKQEFAEFKASADEQIAAFKRNEAVGSYKVQLAKLGFEDVDKMAESLPSDIGDDFFKGLSKWQVESEKKIKAELVKGNPRPGGGNGNNTLTKEDFKKMSYEKRKELKDSDPELYESLRG